jgi:Tfp pilus assembly PilM family ATPase
LRHLPGQSFRFADGVCAVHVAAVDREVVPVYVAAAEAAGGVVEVEVALMMLAIVLAWRTNWQRQVAVLPYFDVLAVLTVPESRMILLQR